MNERLTDELKKIYKKEEAKRDVFGRRPATPEDFGRTPATPAQIQRVIQKGEKK